MVDILMMLVILVKEANVEDTVFVTVNGLAYFKDRKVPEYGLFISLILQNKQDAACHRILQSKPSNKPARHVEDKLPNGQKFGH